MNAEWMSIEEWAKARARRRHPAPLDAIDGFLGLVVAVFWGMVVLGGLLGALVALAK